MSYADAESESCERFSSADFTGNYEFSPTNFTRSVVSATAETATDFINPNDCRAAEMLDELESNYLQVVLIPAREQRHSTHSVRAVQYQNCDWYRKFCEQYTSSRKGTKIRTRIKRRETIAALQKILQGETKGIYVERLLDFIEFEAKKSLEDVPF